MALSAQYVGTPKIDGAIATTADTSRTLPTLANVATVFTAGALGARIDTLNLTGVGTTVTSQLRLWVVKGDKGMAISSLTSSTTVATCTTATAHGLVTGDLVTVQGAFPIEYNVKSTAVVVSSPTVFSYAITSIGSIAATTLGYYSTTRATPSYILLREYAVSAITPSASVSSYSYPLSSQYNADLLPIILPAGYSLRATVNDTQTSSGVNVTAFGGDF